MAPTAAQAVSETVYFTVTVRSEDCGEHWIATGRETGIIASGKTRDEAEDRNGKAHVLLIRRIKREGLQALQAFMDSRDLRYTIGDASQANWQDDASLLAA